MEVYDVRIPTVVTPVTPRVLIVAIPVIFRFLPSTSSYTISPETLGSPVIVATPSTYYRVSALVVPIPTLDNVWIPVELVIQVVLPALTLANLKFFPAA